MQIIPAINVESFEEVKRRVRLVETLLMEEGINWIQIDVGDGTMTPNTSWHEAKDLMGLETPLKIEVQLMIDDLDRRIDNWLLKTVDRIVFHLEGADDVAFVIERIKKAGIEIGIGIAPSTPVEKLKSYLDKIDLVLVLGVNPGLSGQEMFPSTVEKVKDLRKIAKSCIIEVDGGVNTKTAKALVDAGADVLAVGSAIFGQNDIKKAVHNLYESFA